MEDPVSEIRNFFKKCDELLSFSSDANLNPKIVGNYALNREDVSAQVIDWILHYLEDKSCPYQLAIRIAKETAQQINSGISEQQENSHNEENVLNSLTLYNETIKKLTSVCRSFMEKVNESELSTSSLYAASVFAIKNKRRKMEDRHVIHHDLNSLLDLKDVPMHSYYAVFDGHSGVDAASYASAHLHINIANHPAFLINTPKAIADAYQVTDDNFYKKCQEENLKSGTTAVCALIREKTVYLSWLGDSQAVLVKAGKPVIVTSPHKPEREDEKKRIEDLGGNITFIGTWRVNGMLAVTRALGDPDHKPYISSEPEITVINLDGTEDFLILACDGLWDGMSPEDVISALYYNLSQSDCDEPLDTAAAKLVHQSKLRGSEDNITAVVVFLRDRIKIKEDAEKYIPDLSKANLEMSSLDGEERSFHVDEMLNNPISKPTILDLNSSSDKKLKNTAKILNAAGIEDSSFTYSLSENSEEGSSYRTVNIDNCNQSSFSRQQNAVSRVAPETTALSELPTPPIDDLASQQFEKINSADLSRELDIVSSSIPYSDIFSPTNVSSIADVSNVSNATLESEHFNKEFISIETISPNEAVDIASCVVSNTIETAIKSLAKEDTSETDLPINTQKLNPYAEPFIMKSFLTEDIHHEIDASENISVLPESLPVKVNTEKMFLESEAGYSDDFNFNSLKQNSCEDTLCSEIQLSVNDSLLQSTFGPQNVIQTDQDRKLNVILDEENQNIINVKSAKVQELLFSTSDYALETAQIDDKLTLDPNISDKIIGNSSNATNLIEKNNEQMAQSNVKSTLDLEATNAPIESTLLLGSPRHHNNEILTALSPYTSNQESHVQVNDSHSQEIQNQVIENLNFINASLNSDNIFSQNNCIEIGTLEINSSMMVETSNVSDVSLLSDFHEESLILTDNVLTSNQLTQSHIDVPETYELQEEKDIAIVLFESENCLTPEPCVVESSIPLIDMKESLLAAAILPSDQTDDSHIEAVAVDLQTVPVGVPEAEGVTEDIDSDSEKDGGWSYMKGNTVGGVKHKQAVPKSNTGKSSSRTDNSKLKKEISIPPNESKGKLRNVISVDRSKKPILEKKGLEPRDKNKVVKSMPVSSSVKVADKASRVASSASGVKKEMPAAKVSTLSSSSKISKSATAPRNTGAQSKLGNPSTMNRNLVAAKPSINNGILLKPIPTHSIGVKATTSPVTSTPLPKKQPSILQSTKSNATTRTTLTRPTTSTVPNRALSSAKPSSLLRPVAELKPRPLSTTLKKSIPPTFKKPDIKETKDITNKQISEKRNLIPKASSKGSSASSTTSTLRPTVSVGSKSITKSRTAPLKNDIIKKDVPKTFNSQLGAKSNQISKTTMKAKEKNTLPVQNKLQKKSNLEVKKGVKNVTEIATPSEEEKFIHEVNDKEIAAKELMDVAANSVEEQTPIENGNVIGNDAKQLVDEIVGNCAENVL